MGKLYYFCARPETIVSFIHVGRLPDALPEWVTPQIVLYDTSKQCVLTTTTNYHQTFIVELLLPDMLDTHLLTEVKNTATRQVTIQAEQIYTEWIQHIYVDSSQAERLLRNLFNRTLEIPVTQDRSLFDTPIIPDQRPFDSQASSTITPGITYIKKGDLLGSSMQTLINTVNCVGVMGKGIAFGFKQRYPTMFEDYKQRCERGEVQLGIPYLYRINPDRQIINFPTKRHWREKAQLESIETGLLYLRDHLTEWEIKSLAIPPLGCGNGSLDWNQVKPLIERYLQPSNIPLEIYAPFAYKEHQRVSRKRKEPAVSTLYRFFQMPQKSSPIPIQRNPLPEPRENSLPKNPQRT